MDGTTRYWLLAQLGESTDLVDLDARFTRLGTARAVAIEVLKGRLAKLLAAPAVIGVSNVVNVSNVKNIDALTAQITALEAPDAPPAPGEPGYGQPAAPDDGLDIIQICGRRRR